MQYTYLKLHTFRVNKDETAELRGNQKGNWTGLSA